MARALSRNYLYSSYSYIMIGVSANYHWAKMTSSIFMLVVIVRLSKTNYVNFLMLIMVKYFIFHNMS